MIILLNFIALFQHKIQYCLVNWVICPQYFNGETLVRHKEGGGGGGGEVVLEKV